MFSFAQETLSLQDCRALALKNNKQLQIAVLAADMAKNIQQAAKTKYLPRVSGMAGYEHFTREISLLSKKQQNTLSNLGTNTMGKMGSQIGENLNAMAQQGIITPAMAQQLGGVLGNLVTPLTQAGNNIGEALNEALRTNTRNVYAGSIMVTQPIYMGGGIKAANDIAAIGREAAQNDIDLKRQNLLYAIDNAYWLVISLKKKEDLALRYRDLIKHFSDNVGKMYKEGVTTKADGLQVDVKLNTADLQIAQLQNGISLAKMALCQLCGLPLSDAITLEDEQKETLAEREDIEANDATSSFDARPEIRLLANAIEMSRQNTRLIQAIYRPHVALTAGFSVSNPNVFNGFQQRFSGVWNVGVVVQVPIWNWKESKYRLRASQAATNMAELELTDVREKINLEVEQQRFRLNNAEKQLHTAKKNMTAADENLRCANLGFKEGVMTVTEVMAAQTAWMSAKTAIVDAEIAIRTAQVGLKRALGIDLSRVMK